MIRFIFILSLICKITSAQQVSTIKIHSDSTYDNILNTKLFSDSLSSSFLISIKKEVKEHKHVSHSEHVVVLDGSGRMSMADSSFMIKNGDVIFIPMNTFHSVKTTSEIPLKIISIQSPYFDGTDRVYR